LQANRGQNPAAKVVKMSHLQFVVATIAAAMVCLSASSCNIVRLGGRALLGQPDIPVGLAQARVRLSYNVRQGAFGVTRLHNSIRLSKIATAVTVGGRTFASSDERCTKRIVRRDALRLIVRSAFPKGPAWETQFEIRTHSNEGNATLDHALRDGYGVAVACRLVGDVAPSDPPRFSLIGQALAEQEAFACRLAPTTHNRPAACSTASLPLQIASGDVASRLNTSFYDPKRDCALHLGAPQVIIGPSEERPGGKTFPIRLDFDSRAGLDFVEDFYKTAHGFAYFEGTDHNPLRRSIAGWLDWYVTYGQTSEDLILRNVNWLADNLRDYGLELIQIDDGWQGHHGDRLPGDLGKKPTDWLHANENFPHGMAWLAGRIHEKGFLAGLWLVPYATNDAALLREHPDWFLEDPDGGRKTGQGDWARQFGYVLDFGNAQVRRHYLTPLFKTLSSRWEYDYFKLDATGWTLLGIKDQAFPNRAFVAQKLGKKSLSGTEIAREGLEAVRHIVGKKFILACHAPCTEVVGLVDAARVAGDMSPGWEKGPLHLLRQTMESFHTHGICWLNDPDCLVIRPPLTLEQARLFASMFGLTGQHLMLSDLMDGLDAERVEILRRILPVCATRPLDLYPRPDQATVWDLKIERPFGSWDVVGVFNFEEQPARHLIHFADLGLTPESPFIVYDFWNRRCLGRFEREIAIELPPTACRVLAIHREIGRPQVVSTNRHITQGGEDLVKMVWNSKRSELSGRSRAVRNEPYELRLWVPEGFRPIAAESSAPQARLEISDGGRIAVVRLASQQTGELRWLVRFQKNYRSL